MRILAVDIGTGTQDILLFDSRLDMENGFKLVLPSPTMIMHDQIRAATKRRSPIVLTGRQMGGGPSAWAAEAHARAGLRVYATPEAALTFDDELDKVVAAGIHIVSDDEARALKPDVLRLEFKDFDHTGISEAFAGFGVSLQNLDAIAVAVFDHGAAPPGTSDRQFRFDYLDARIRERNSLSAFAYLSNEVPPIMSRLQAVAACGSTLDCPLIVMDSAPAAVLGATFDPIVARCSRSLIANLGNFHSLAFRLGPDGIEGLFEHHTGEIDRPKLETMLRALADGTLRHADVFNDMGHGALIYSTQPLELGTGTFGVIVTGPRRSMFGREGDVSPRGSLRPYFAVPFGDMMLAGCFGLIAATGDVLPHLAGAIQSSMRGPQGPAVAPWDLA